MDACKILKLKNFKNGLGEHNWYLARVDMTQYALRNTYFGNFKHGKRHRQGTFLYANGAKYEGTWENNLKHGWVRFKKRCIYFSIGSMCD